MLDDEHLRAAARPLSLGHTLMQGQAAAGKRPPFNSEEAQQAWERGEGPFLAAPSRRSPAGDEGHLPTRGFFAGFQGVIIDEVHSFAADDRGSHLSWLMERLTRFCDRDLQRLGLSVTVGNPKEILRWIQGTSRRPAEAVAPKGSSVQPELALDFVATLENAVDRRTAVRTSVVDVMSKEGSGRGSRALRLPSIQVGYRCTSRPFDAQLHT